METETWEGWQLTAARALAGPGKMGGSKCALLLPAARPLFWQMNRRHSGHK
jgi:hypothetical protein